MDLASAISDTININRGQTNNYQYVSHKYFLTTDTALGATVKYVHKSLGDDTDYIADTQFDYYSKQTYSVVYNGTTLVYNQDFVVADGNEIRSLLMYMLVTCNNKNNIMLDVYAHI